MTRFEESMPGDVLSLDVENCIPVYLFECFYYHRWITWIYFLYNLFDVILFFGGSLAERGCRCVSCRSLSFFVFLFWKKNKCLLFFYLQISLMTHYLFFAALRSIRFTLAHSLVCVLASKRLLVGGSMKGQRWPARCSAPLSALAVPCQSGTQNSYEKYFSVIDWACLAPLKHPNPAQLAPSKGTSKRSQVFGRISALIWPMSACDWGVLAATRALTAKIIRNQSS